MTYAALAFVLVFACRSTLAEPRNLHAIPSDLTVPALTEGPPAAGKRVKQNNPGYEGWDLFHVLYLPAEWQPGGKYPVIVEYPGNGGYKNSLGDVCTGKPEDCKLGYGLSAGRGMIWVCLPFVNREEKKHQLQWWGDPDATADYCVQTVQRICREYGGDPAAVLLTGFSRGAIACNYIGLRNDEIAALWRAMLPHSHYDGVRKWPHADSDAVSAAARLARLRDRPQFISQETSVEPTREFLQQHAPAAKFTFLALPYPNHSDEWVLKDIPERAQARAWLAKVLELP
jgi:acetyl esterase/lipase